MSDIWKQLEAFIAHLVFLPKCLITDFDTKLIGGKAREYLNSLLIHINTAPAYHQDKNGLAEHHWQTIVAMARSWLASVELPGSFWFYSVKRAAEICNFFPINLSVDHGLHLLELAHQVKPDLHILFKLFGVAAVHWECQGEYTDECMKFLLKFLGVKDIFMPSVNTIYNDNMACVNWSKCSTTKGLRHIQMKENQVRESIASNFVSIWHIDGKINIADIFTKEM